VVPETARKEQEGALKKTVYTAAVSAAFLLLTVPQANVFAAGERERELGKSKEQVARENTEYID
jgi:hypothetical protein